MINPLTNVPEGEPSRAVAGDTWSWKRSDLGSDFPFDQYVLTYAFKRDGSTIAPTIVTATGSASGFAVTVAATTTTNFTPGSWSWDAFMTRTTDSARVRIDTGRIEVLPNSAVSSADTRSHARRMLTAIEALLEGRSVADVASYSIKDRSLTKLTPEELTSWRNYYKREVQREDAAEAARQGKATGRTTAVRFRM
jgi:hypothetical protein